MLEPEMITNLREKLSAIFEEGVEREIASSTICGKQKVCDNHFLATYRAIPTP